MRRWVLLLVLGWASVVPVAAQKAGQASAAKKQVIPGFTLKNTNASPKGVVEQSVDAFNNNAKMFLLIAPEGTRSNATEWKRGFYHIASGAQVPILPAACDYQKKIITFGPAVMPCGDYAEDLRTILEFYRDFGVARHPDRMSKPVCDIKGMEWKPSSSKDD